MTIQFNLSELVGQFILGRRGTHVPDGWSSERLGGWVLGLHPSLPGIRLLGDDDQVVGWLLGFAIDGKGKLWNGKETMRIREVADSAASRIEEFVYSFGGRFLVALIDVPQPRLYLDPCGSLGVVYCAHQKVVASTPNLIPYDEQTRDRVDLAREMGIPHTDAMYPLELTPRHSVERLIPNHYLDLSNWKPVRHWPTGPLPCDGSVEEAVIEVAEITKRHISAIVSRHPTYLRLTSGGDSRMLLACGRNVADRLELFTVPIPDDGGYVDVAIARKIAKRFRLRHLVPKYRTSNPEDMDRYMFRIGYGTGEPRGWQTTTMFQQANPKYAQLDGAIGGLERGTRYKISDTEFTRITPERLLEQCNAPLSELTLAPLQRWLETVPAIDALQLLDLFYLEQRLGCWGGVLPYAEGGDPGFVIYPMCHREIITRMLTLPTPYRISGFHACEVTHSGAPPFMKAIVEREWPELLAWPFNEPTGFMHLRLAVRRVRRGLSSHAGRAWHGFTRQAGHVGKGLRNPAWAGERIWNRLTGREEKCL